MVIILAHNRNKYDLFILVILLLCIALIILYFYLIMFDYKFVISLYKISKHIL